MSSRHTFKLLNKPPLPRPASHSILYWEMLKLIKRKKGEYKTLFEKRYHRDLQRYKSYRFYLRLRHCKIAWEARSNMEMQYIKKPRNPE